MTKYQSDDYSQLVDTLLHDEDPILRCRAAVGLGYLGGDGVSEILASVVLHDADWGVRQNAAWAIGQLRLVSGVTALNGLLMQETDEQVLYVGALALVRINSLSAIQCLATHARSEYEKVRRVVAAAHHASSYMISLD